MLAIAFRGCVTCVTELRAVMSSSVAHRSRRPRHRGANKARFGWRASRGCYMLQTMKSNHATSFTATTPLEYRRIERAIRFMDERFREQPRLEQVARAAGVAPHHFARMFRRWAGISPKQFVQRLTLEAARSSLVGDESVLQAALDAGLSGPGRLHDLFVTLEAVTPGRIQVTRARAHDPPRDRPPRRSARRSLRSPAGHRLRRLRDVRRRTCRLGRIPASLVRRGVRRDQPSADEVAARIWGAARAGRAVAAVGARLAISRSRSGRRCCARARLDSQLFRHRARDRAAQRLARGRRRGRREPRRLAHTLPPRAARKRRARRLPMGRRTQAGDARVGVVAAPCRRGEPDARDRRRDAAADRAATPTSVPLSSSSRPFVALRQHRAQHAFLDLGERLEVLPRHVRDGARSACSRRSSRSGPAPLPAGSGTSRRSSRGSRRGIPASRCHRSG